MQKLQAFTAQEAHMADGYEISMARLLQFVCSGLGDLHYDWVCKKWALPSSCLVMIAFLIAFILVLALQPLAYLQIRGLFVVSAHMPTALPELHQCACYPDTFTIGQPGPPQVHPHAL